MSFWYCMARCSALNISTRRMIRGVHQACARSVPNHERNKVRINVAAWHNLQVLNRQEGALPWGLSASRRIKEGLKHGRQGWDGQGDLTTIPTDLPDPWHQHTLRLSTSLQLVIRMPVLGGLERLAWPGRLSPVSHISCRSGSRTLYLT